MPCRMVPFHHQPGQATDAVRPQPSFPLPGSTIRLTREPRAYCRKVSFHQPRHIANELKSLPPFPLPGSHSPLIQECLAQSSKLRRKANAHSSSLSDFPIQPKGSKSPFILFPIILITSSNPLSIHPRWNLPHRCLQSYSLGRTSPAAARGKWTYPICRYGTMGYNFSQFQRPSCSKPI